MGCLYISNHEVIDGFSSETVVRLFNKHDTTDCRLLWGKTQSNYKDHEFKAVTCNNCNVKVFLLSEREISPNYSGIFLDFVHRFGSDVKGLPKTKRCNLVAVMVSVQIRCICEKTLSVNIGTS